MPGDTRQFQDGEELVDDPDGNCCFNCKVGLPTRKWESEISDVDAVPVPLTGSNYRMLRNYHDHKLYSQNKCRGSGATEILTVRYMVFKYAVLNREPNRKCVIVPGTSSKLSSEISIRIKAICDKIPQVYGIIPTSSQPKEFVFKSKGKIILTNATPDAVRGKENIGDLIDEEVDHWNLIDDMDVYYASHGVYEKTQCHMIHNTTPKKKTGFYYTKVWGPDATSSYFRHVTNWREIVGLPVPTIEELYGFGHIDEKKLQELRDECVRQYHENEEYREWYENFEKSGVKVFWFGGELIPIEQLIDVKIPLLDVNAIISDSQTDRSHYDQELDNEFISSENRAIGQFAEDDFVPDDLDAQIEKFNSTGHFDPGDYV